MNPLVVTFFLYLLFMLIVGVVFYRTTGDLSDYILGGRKLGPLVAALSVCASDMSGWLLMGLPGAVYSSGLNQLWITFGLIAGAYLNWRLVARRLRIYTESAGNSLTIPDYLENRFYHHRRSLRVVSAFLILFFFGIYTASGLVAGAILFQKTFGVAYQVALLLGSAVIISYTFLGGFLAVSWTDFFQGSLMFFALLLVPAIVVADLGGPVSTLERLQYRTSFLDLMAGMDGVAVVSLMAWGLGYFGQPHILARFMAIENPARVRRATAVAMGWMVITLYGAVVVGLTGAAYFLESPLQNPETVFISLAKEFFNPWVAGVFLAAVLAAVMSTVDSQLLVCASVISEDFYRAFFRGNASRRELLWVGRASVLLVSLFALLLASDPESSVLRIVAYAWAGLGASFGPVVLLSLYFRKMTSKGALAGMLTGATVVILWKNLSGGIFDLYELLPGFVLATVAIVLVSLADKRPPEVNNRTFALKDEVT